MENRSIMISAAVAKIIENYARLVVTNWNSKYEND